jgi:hypothetical protein
MPAATDHWLDAAPTIPSCRRNRNLVAAVEVKSSPWSSSDQVGISRNEEAMAVEMGNRHILAVVDGCKSLRGGNLNEPVSFFLDPVSLLQQGLLLRHHTAADVLCLNIPAQHRPPPENISRVFAGQKRKWAG